MVPSARIQAAIEILEGLSGSRMPADRYIREYFRCRRYAGSKDRAAVAERVYDIFRHRASFAWRMESESPRALAIASVLAEQGDVDALFAGGYGPQPLTEEERAAIAVPSREPPLHVRGEYPEFLDAELQRAFDGHVLDEMAATQARAPVDLRVNALKGSRDEVLAALQADGFAAEATRYAQWGIRVPAGARGLERHALFLGGAFEFQDEAAQIAVTLADARSGMRVLDLAAGAGGKTLALAAAMKNEGEIVAYDIDENRLRQIAPRAARAGVTIVEATTAVPAPSADLVFLDAPCSGSGTWRRQPENKWRLTPERLDELNAIQDSLLERAAACAPRIVYATCSVLPCENEDRVAGFLTRHSDYAVVSAAEIWRATGHIHLPPGMDGVFRASPLRTHTDGFFAAILAQRK